VILDFWATWCAPCIESFPHLEALQKQFGSDLQIITITDESEERILKFLQKRPLSLPVALDADRKLANEFPHRTIPHTIVIDKQGMVSAITNPKELTGALVQKIIDGQTVQLTEKKDAMDFDPAKPLSANENFTYQITVTPYQEGVPSYSNTTGNGVYQNRRILCTNLTPRILYEIAYQFPVNIRTVVEVKNKTPFDYSKENIICFDLIVPEELGEKRFDIMQQHLSFLYPFKAGIEKRKTKVKVLKVISGKTFSVLPSDGGKEAVTSGGDGLSMKNAALSAVAEFLQDQLNKPVLDETGIKGIFNLTLKWYNEDPKQIHEELKKIGLEMIDAERDLDVLVISDR
jgi:hypothetical protein